MRCNFNSHVERTRTSHLSGQVLAAAAGATAQGDPGSHLRAPCRGWIDLPLGVDCLLRAQQQPRQGGEEPEAHLRVAGRLEAAPKDSHQVG